MARQRKKQHSASIPLVPPSQASSRPQPSKPLVEISDDETWRFVKQSGILDSQAATLESPSVMTLRPGETMPEILAEVTPLSDEIFNAILLIMPFSAVLLLMEILIRHQYGKTASFEAIMDRMIPSVPILSLFIFYTTRYKQDRRMQALLFVISFTVGSRMIFLLNNASWLVNMKQCPPLATLWIYTVVQLDLAPAVLSLLAIAAFVKWKDLKVLQ
ncbi:hypothetical protein M413DRAFT_441352 [Hebeloma cylindrosporum]|uniref:DUF7719 domain-containing protein n=1 Tax=Hebeloma cylindrosporum TaxID=76867 RepID=A0A0C3CQW5_HEBCY|nr:hypothetical protein M413DRAFT_441352 [Hebeloma cylindrosporum h7]